MFSEGTASARSQPLVSKDVLTEAIKADLGWGTKFDDAAFAMSVTTTSESSESDDDEAVVVKVSSSQRGQSPVQATNASCLAFDDECGERCNDCRVLFLFHQHVLRCVECKDQWPPIELTGADIPLVQVANVKCLNCLEEEFRTMKERSYDGSKGLSAAGTNAVNGTVQRILPPSDAEEHAIVTPGKKKSRKSISMSRNLSPCEEEAVGFREGALSDGTCGMKEANASSPSIDQVAYMIEPTTVNLMGEEVNVLNLLKKSRFRRETERIDCYDGVKLRV